MVPVNVWYWYLATDFIIVIYKYIFIFLGKK
jgi:hypothetical protein